MRTQPGPASIGPSVDVTGPEKIEPDLLLSLQGEPDQFAAAMREYLRAKVEQRAPDVTIADKGKTAPQVINIMDALTGEHGEAGRAKVREAVRTRMGKAAPKRQRVPQSAAQSKSGS